MVGYHLCTDFFLGAKADGDKVELTKIDGRGKYFMSGVTYILPDKNI